MNLADPKRTRPRTDPGRWLRALVLVWLGCLLASANDLGQKPTASVPPESVKALEAPGLHSLFQLTTNVFSGGAPEDDAGFAALAKLGIKTLISVDGARPQVDLARRHGLRYIHLPQGYDGISTDAQVRLIKAASTAAGAVFVHCHHGKHRGPAAAAILCRASAGWSAAQADGWLRRAGTGTNYTGLYAAARDFRPPSTSALAAKPEVFPETARVSGLVDAMVGLDERWERLQLLRKAGYRTPTAHPDITPAHEALLLKEAFRELARLPESVNRGANFLQALQDSESHAARVEHALTSAIAPTAAARVELDRELDALQRGCANCHRTQRDATRPTR